MFRQRMGKHCLLPELDWINKLIQNMGNKETQSATHLYVEKETFEFWSEK